MNEMRVEQVGGSIGFGGPLSHAKSWGVVDLSHLSQADRATVESLFQRYRASPGTRSYAHEFLIRLTRQTPAGAETVDVPEHEVPDVVKTSVSTHLE